MSRQSAAQQQQTRTSVLLEDSKRQAFQSVEIGRNTLDELARQKETLHSAEDILEEHENIIHKSLRVMRGMTWSGMIYNSFTSDVTVNTGASRGKFEDSDTVDLANPSSHPSSSYDETLRNKDDPDLKDIHIAVTELASIAATMGEEISAQNKMMNRLEDRIDIVNDKTLGASLKASQITRGSGRRAGNYVGRFQLRDEQYGLFLSVNEDFKLFLSSFPDRSSYFDCYVKAENIYSLQNSKTLLFVGSNWSGGVRCQAMYFGKLEECYVNCKDGDVTGIFLLGMNWGSGGWLKKPVNPKELELMSITSSVTDKKDMITFRVIQQAVAEDGESNAAA